MGVDRYSLIVIGDERSPIRRFDLRRTTLRWFAAGIALAVACVALVVADYLRLRSERADLIQSAASLQSEQSKLAGFEEQVTAIEAKLERVREFERKLRIIANLPGSVAAGGADVGPAAVGPTGGDGAPAATEGLDLPETEAAEPGPAESAAPHKAAESSAEDRVSALRAQALQLDTLAALRGDSLQQLIAQIEDKQAQLAASPAIWPAEGWLTSGFGTRISPFTGKRQRHSGIDIAGEIGIDVRATASGRVVFAGLKTGLGRFVSIDHGNGIVTHYAHNHQLFVERGDRVERGTRIASLGNSGRSTGPHLHYEVEVSGKAVDPIDYIFD